MPVTQLGFLGMGLLGMPVKARIVPMARNDLLSRVTSMTECAPIRLSKKSGKCCRVLMTTKHLRTKKGGDCVSRQFFWCRRAWER